MELLMSLLGVLLGIGLFIGGFFFGKYVYAPKSLLAPNLSDEEKAKIKEEREQLIAEQKAFRSLMDYNADMAYGVNDSALPKESG